MSLSDEELIKVRTQIVSALVLLDELQGEYPVIELAALEKSLEKTVADINTFLGVKI